MLGDDTFVLAAILAFGIWLLAIGRLGFLLLIAFGSLNTLIGLVGLAELNGDAPDYIAIFVGCNLAILAGYVLAGRRRKTVEAIEVASDGVPRRLTRGVTAAVVLAGGLAVYHLLVAGIPLFASDIEVARFDFTSSGLMGIPGRMYLFGVAISCCMASAAATIHGVRWRDYTPWRIAFALLIAISILGGLKSGIVGLATTLIVISVVMTGRQMYIRTAIARYWWVAAAGLAYGAAVAATYVTYQRMGGSFLGSIFDRLTVIGAEPKRIALLGEVAVPTGGVVSDFLYFLTKYTGGDVSGRYTLERAVSAKIVGVDPASNAWTTPVTVGAIPEMVLFFGPIIAIVLCVAIGVAMRRFTKIAAQGFWRMSSIGVAALMFFTWMSRGGLAYYVTNYAIVTLLLFGTCYIFYLFSSGLERSSKKTNPRAANSGIDVDLSVTR